MVKQRFALIALLLCLSSFPVFAQEATEEPLPVVIIEEEAAVLGTLPEPTQLEEDLSDQLTGKGLFVAAAATLVFTLTGFLKLIPFLKGVSSNQIKLVLNIIVWGVYIGASYFGRTAEFDTGLSLATEAVTGLAGFITTLGGSAWLFKLANQNDVPVLGHQRTTPPL